MFFKASSYQQFSDAELLQQYRNTSKNEWLGILLQRYTLLLLGVCMKYLKNEALAQDAVQQVFVKVIADIDKYEVQFFKSWLYTVAKNYCLMQLRHKLATEDVTFNEALEQTKDDDSSIYIEKENLLQSLEICLPCLNQEQQLCINLFYLKNKSYLEIVQLTNFTLMQVKSHIQNGKRNLKKCIEQKIKQQERNG